MVNPRPAGDVAVMDPAPRRLAPLRVLYVLDNLEIGGTELNAVRTAEQLDRSRFEVSFLCLREGPLRARLDAAGIPVRRLEVRGLASLSALRAGQEIRRIVRRERIDVVHAHDPYANVLAVPWARLARRVGVIASQRWWRNVHPTRVRVANRLSYSMAHRVLVNSAAIGELLVQRERVPRDKVVVVPNFVARDAFTPLPPARREQWRQRFGVADNAIAVGVVANLHPVKNHGMLLRALARVARERPRLTAVFVGDGSERASLEAQVRALGLGDQVRFAGRVAHEPGLPSVFDIVALPSREEGFPNAVVEAMAAGRPVVATAAGGTVDAVVPGQTGFLVPVDDDAAMADALERLASDVALRERLGAAGQRRAEERFTAEVVLGELGTLYAKLAGAVHQG